MTRVPRVSIGLPVYNGENFLAESLDALLAQTFTDFELIISDNASTDATPAICKEYAARDPRIRYVRQPQNIGATPNQDFVFRQSRGELFKLAAHDDLYDENLIARCVEALDAHPEVVLCHADMAYVDSSGRIINRYDYHMATDSPDAAVRFQSLLHGDGGDDEYGVVRSAVLRQVRPCGSFHNSGRPFVAEIALHGPFHQVRELMYFRRDHPARGDRRATIADLCANLDPRRKGQSTVRLVTEYLLAYVSAIWRAPISMSDRVTCYRHYAAWLARRLGPHPVRSAAGVLRGFRPGTAPMASASDT
jgi:glycosyltransferase involved in cell wall biosynthesis